MEVVPSAAPMEEDAAVAVTAAVAGGGGEVAEKKRRRTEIKKITNKSARTVTFTKRRAGLFKRIEALSQEHRLDYFVVVFSPAGRAYHEGNPNLMRALIDRRNAGDVKPHAGKKTKRSIKAGAPPKRPAGAAPSTSSAPLMIGYPSDPSEEDRDKRRHLHVLMTVRQMVAERIKLLTGNDVAKTMTLQHHLGIK